VDESVRGKLVADCAGKEGDAIGIPKETNRVEFAEREGGSQIERGEGKPTGDRKGKCNWK
jgi:hypothetical protein